MTATSDASFGPQVGGEFDFTLVFEHSILSIGPSSVLLAASALRIAVLTRRRPSFEAGTLLWTKLVRLPKLTPDSDAASCLR